MHAGKEENHSVKINHHPNPSRIGNFDNNHNMMNKVDNEMEGLVAMLAICALGHMRNNNLSDLPPT